MEYGVYAEVVTEGHTTTFLVDTFELLAEAEEEKPRISEELRENPDYFVIEVWIQPT